MPNPIYTYVSNIWFRLVGFYCISTIVGYLMSSLYKHIKYLRFKIYAQYYTKNHGEKKITSSFIIDRYSDKTSMA